MNSAAPSENCPYLGLNDDPDTALSYPSSWNYCFRARPPASVDISHQAETCLTCNHRNCPVFLAERKSSLPANLRGKRAGGSRIWILLLIIGLVLAALWGGRSHLSFFLPPVSTPELGGASTEPPSPSDTSAATSTDWINPAMAVTFEAFAPIPSATPLSSGTDLPIVVPSNTPIRPPTSVPGACGHELDVPFGTAVRLVMHLVAGGETLDAYSNTYQTNVEAITAINFDMHVPLWKDWVVVIPIGTTDVDGVPPFDKYQATGQTLSTVNMAAMLNTDVQLFKQFNLLDDTCKLFSGWLLVPRTRQ